MLSPSDLARMRADLDAIIGDHDQEIVIRRGKNTVLDPQTVRIERGGQGGSRHWQRDGSEERRTGVVVVGDTTLDIQKDDRFTVGGELYKVTAVSPNKQMGIQAEAELAQ